MSMAPVWASIIWGGVESSVSKLQPKPQAQSKSRRIGIAVWIGGWVRVGHSPHSGSLSKLSLQIACYRGLPVELVFELSNGVLLCLKLPFKFCDFFLLGFKKCVHASGLCVTFVGGALPRDLKWFCPSWRGDKYEGQAGGYGESMEQAILEGSLVHGPPFLTYQPTMRIRC